MLTQILHLGTRGVTEEKSKKKIILTNKIALIFLCLALFYTVRSSFLLPKIAFIPVIGAFIMLVAFTLTYLGFLRVARFLVAITPTVIGELFYATLSQGNADILVGGALLIFGFVIIPFTVFDLSEKPLLVSSFSFCALCITLHPVFNTWINIELDSSPFRTPVAQILLSVMSILIIFLNLMILQGSNRKSEKSNLKLIEEMEAKGLEVEKYSKQLEKIVEEVKTAREEDERRNWAATSIAEVSLLLRQENDLQKLYDQLISRLVRYVNANQGGFFIVKDDQESGKYIELAACYAYNRKKYVEKRIAIGQGLIGQCYLEKEKILLTQVPQQYVQITSGLGDANPACIVIIPLLFNEEVEGLIEIASFQVLQPYQLEFLEKIGENVAAFLKNAKITLQMQDLFEESQRQTQVMKEQEEEKRQHLERLMATLEEMERKERAYQEKIEHLEAQSAGIAPL